MPWIGFRTWNPEPHTHRNKKEKKGANMRRAVILCGTASFVMAFLGGVLAFTLVAPSSATAQSSQAQEVRASAFTLVGADGTVIARLVSNQLGGGVLQLAFSDGATSATYGGVGITTYGISGNATFRAGQCLNGPCPGGLPPFNGVELGPGGSIRMLPSSESGLYRNNFL